MFPNPDHPDAHALSAWYQSNGASLTDLQNISKQARGGEGGGAAASQRKVLSDIKDENLGMKEKPDFFVTRATITFFKHDFEKGALPWYNACPSQGCNKKVRSSSSSCNSNSSSEAMSSSDCSRSHSVLTCLTCIAPHVCVFR